MCKRDRALLKALEASLAGQSLTPALIAREALHKALFRLASFHPKGLLFFLSYPQQLFFFLRFYFLFIQRERDWQRHRQREKQAPCRKPDVGLDSESPGSRPGLGQR